MAQLKVSIDDFYVHSYYTCTTLAKTVYADSTHTTVESQSTTTTTTTPTLGWVNKTFNFALPNGATIKSAKVCVDNVGYSTVGTAYAAINDVQVSEGNAAAVDVTINDGDTSVTISFAFRSRAVSHDHFALGTGIWKQGYWEGNTLFNPVEMEHTTTMDYRGVYLLIEYTPAVEFTGWTDDPLTAGETYVKAVHMSEMQEWTALLSEYANNGTPTFTPAVPGETSLALWLTQVQEIRAVLDVISPEHDAWIEVAVNCPRADVMEQIRAVIVAAM